MVGVGDDTARRSRGLALVWASVAGGCFGQAYLWHAAFAWAGAVALGLALTTGVSSRRQTAARVGLIQLWVGIFAWGFAHHGWPLFLAQALFLGVSGALVGALAWVPRGPSSLRLALAWSGVEYLRQLGPWSFPLLLGGTQVHTPLRSALGSVGAIGLSGLLVGLGVAVSRAIRARQSTAGRRTCGRAIIGWLAAIALCLGLGRWQPDLAPDGPAERVRLVQGSVPNWLYLAASRSDVAWALVEARYLELSRQALSDDADLVLLPESALQRAVTLRDGRADRPLFGVPPEPVAPPADVVTGAYVETLNAGGTTLQLWNAALALRGDDPRTVRDELAKRQLAPIAEDRLTAGDRSEPLALHDRTLSVLICYESMYPRLARSQAAGAPWLAVLTNDAGFETSPPTLTHARQGWSRAVETGRPLMRVAQSGLSLVVDHRGEPLVSLGLFEQGVLQARVQPMRGATWFTRGGYLVGPLSAVAMLLLAAADLVRRRRVQSNNSNSST